MGRVFLDLQHGLTPLGVDFKNNPELFRSTLQGCGSQGISSAGAVFSENEKGFRRREPGKPEVRTAKRSGAYQKDAAYDPDKQKESVCCHQKDRCPADVAQFPERSL